LGDTAVKKRLEDVLQTLIAPIRERRAIFAARPDDVLDIIRSGTATSRAVTQATLEEVRDALGLFALRDASHDATHHPFDLRRE
jgi:tryptophanyl-tRNA synthetase